MWIWSAVFIKLGIWKKNMPRIRELKLKVEVSHFGLFLFKSYLNDNQYQITRNENKGRGNGPVFGGAEAVMQRAVLLHLWSHLSLKAFTCTLANPPLSGSVAQTPLCCKKSRGESLSWHSCFFILSCASRWGRVHMATFIVQILPFLETLHCL